MLVCYANNADTKACSSTKKAEEVLMEEAEIIQFIGIRWKMWGNVNTLFQEFK